MAIEVETAAMSDEPSIAERALAGQLHPLGARVLVRRSDPRGETHSGIVLPDKAQRRQLHGHVLCVGPEVEADLSPGDFVVFRNHLSTKLPEGSRQVDQRLILVDEDKLLMKITQDGAELPAEPEPAIPLWRAVTYYTPGYADLAEEWSGSMEALSIDHQAEAQSSRGSWEKNCAIKPEFLQAQLDQARMDPTDYEYILWLDVDALMHGYIPPEVFEGKPDIAVHYRAGTELLSGTILLRVCPRVAELLELWQSCCEAYPNQWDQRCLEKVLHRVPGLTIKLLPPEMCVIPEFMDVDREDWIVEHRQVSREVRTGARVS